MKSLNSLFFNHLYFILCLRFWFLRNNLIWSYLCLSSHFEKTRRFFSLSLITFNYIMQVWVALLFSILSWNFFSFSFLFSWNSSDDTDTTSTLTLFKTFINTFLLDFFKLMFLSFFNNFQELLFPIFIHLFLLFFDFFFFFLDRLFSFHDLKSFRYEFRRIIMIFNLKNSRCQTSIDFITF